MEPNVHVLNKLAPSSLHENLWATCNSKNWYFGNFSVEEHSIPFWKMELDQNDTADALWNHVKPKCENKVGKSLSVLRQYANGHTYGLGGQPHIDDEHPDTYTLLYYPMLEWDRIWGGETIFYDNTGNLAAAVAVHANRGILFDSRILHSGRAPCRQCPGLRVTVAYKLKAGDALEST